MWDRRSFLKVGVGGVLTAATTQALPWAFEVPTAGCANRNVVMVNVRGGWDSLSIVVPYSRDMYHRRRPSLAIAPPDSRAPDSALPIDDDVGISPLAAPLHRIIMDGHGVVVAKVGYPGPDPSHFASQDIMSKGLRDFSHPDARGWLGRLGDTYSSAGIEVVGLRTGNKLDFVGYDSRTRILDELADTGDDFAPSVHYPDGAFAGSLRDVASLIGRAGGARVFYVETGGFDTHTRQREKLHERLTNLAGAIGGFVEDLKLRGAFEDTTIVMFSEFGRSNGENTAAGTDHGHGSHFIVIGGGLAGGLEGSPVTDADLARDALPMEIDFRQVYWEVLASRLRVDPAPIFPGFTPPTPRLGLFAASS